MKRRELFRLSSAMGLSVALPSLAAAAAVPASTAGSLTPPAEGSIPVAVLLSQNAEMIDFAGPWEVFDNVNVPGRKSAPGFRLFTVAETMAPIRASGGMTIIPDYTFETAPVARVIVIPAQSEPNEKVLAWVRQASHSADLTMSVCTGAFLLAKTGLLSGRPATTHHGFFGQFTMMFPDVSLKRGARYVESGKFATAGGLSSGIDLALRVVERYFGRDVASNTANFMEYQGRGWLDPNSNSAYARMPRSTDAHPLCPVCTMEVARVGTASSVYRGRTYYFCMEGHKQLFDAAPKAYLG